MKILAVFLMFGAMNCAAFPICTATSRGVECHEAQPSTQPPPIQQPTAPVTFCEVRILYSNDKPGDVMVEIPVGKDCDQGGAEAAISTYLQQLLNGKAVLPR
jgi:hypothetical protein